MLGSRTTRIGIRYIAGICATLTMFVALSSVLADPPLPNRGTVLLQQLVEEAIDRDDPPFFNPHNWFFDIHNKTLYVDGEIFNPPTRVIPARPTYYLRCILASSFTAENAVEAVGGCMVAASAAGALGLAAVCSSKPHPTPSIFDPLPMQPVDGALCAHAQGIINSYSLLAAHCSLTHDEQRVLDEARDFYNNNCPST